MKRFVVVSTLDELLVRMLCDHPGAEKTRPCPRRILRRALLRLARDIPGDRGVLSCGRFFVDLIGR
jgi:hypothetical protein